MRRFAPIILVALIAAGVVLFTMTTGRQQAVQVIGSPAVWSEWLGGFAFTTAS